MTICIQIQTKGIFGIYKLPSILLRKPTQIRAIISRPQIDCSGFDIEILTFLSLFTAHITELADALEESKITSKQGKEVFAEMLETSKYPDDIIAFRICSDDEKFDASINYEYDIDLNKFI